MTASHVMPAHRNAFYRPIIYEARSRDTYKGSSYVLVFMDELSERTRSPLFKMNDPNNGTNPIEQISIQSKIPMRIT